MADGAEQPLCSGQEARRTASVHLEGTYHPIGFRKAALLHSHSRFVSRVSAKRLEVRRGSKSISSSLPRAERISVRLIGGRGRVSRRLGARRASDEPQDEVWQDDARHCRAADAAVAGPRAAVQAAETGGEKGAGVVADGGCAAPRPPVSVRMHRCTPLRTPTGWDQLGWTVSDGCINPLGQPRRRSQRRGGLEAPVGSLELATCCAGTSVADAFSSFTMLLDQEVEKHRICVQKRSPGSAAGPDAQAWTPRPGDAWGCCGWCARSSWPGHSAGGAGGRLCCRIRRRLTGFSPPGRRRAG